ncbi:hypothetical protein V1638_11685 [Pseudarthrobacter sp. J64]|nr:hypothetical protein [Pseudarthrobacter sp. J64]MEE2570053.1 hypothetical protein [Pseudarthrobacter sp. J64]
MKKIRKLMSDVVRPRRGEVDRFDRDRLEQHREYVYVLMHQHVSGIR